MQHCGRGARVTVRRVQLDLKCAAGSARRKLLLLFPDTDAALLRDGCGIDAVHYLRVCEDATNRSIADQFSLPLPDPTGVGDLMLSRFPGTACDRNKPSRSAISIYGAISLYS